MTVDSLLRAAVRYQLHHKIQVERVLWLLWGRDIGNEGWVSKTLNHPSQQVPDKLIPATNEPGVTNILVLVFRSNHLTTDL